MDLNPALVMDLLASLSNKQSSQDMKSSIGLLRTNMNNEHVGILKQIAENHKVMQEVAKANKASFWDKIFGWLGVAILDVVAVVAEVATAGGATGLLVAATMATAMMTLQQTGVMGDLTKAIARSLENDGLSSKAANAMAEAFTVAMVITAVIVTTVASGGLGAAGAVTELSEDGDMAGTEMEQFGENTDDQEMDEIQQQASKAQRLQMNVQKLANLGRLTNVILNLGNTGGNIASSIFNADELDAKASSLDWGAWINRNEKLVTLCQNAVKEMVQTIQQNTDTTTQAISNYMRTQEKVAQYSQV